jgi:hypothetical protein
VNAAAAAATATAVASVFAGKTTRPALTPTDVVKLEAVVRATEGAVLFEKTLIDTGSV